MHRILSLALAVALAFAGHPVAFAGDEASKAAWELLENEKHAEAQAAYEEIAKADPEDGKAWFMVGYAYHAGGDYPRALEAYDAALENGAQAAITEYNIGCAHALLGNADEAFAHLDAAMEAGFGDARHMKSDPDLESLHADVRWEGAAARAFAIGSPCSADESMSQFDFWLGTWKVKTADGEYIGKNTVEAAYNDCVVMEHWQGADHMTGMSMSYYDPAAGQWVQLWRGDRGSLAQLTGGLDESGAMVLSGTSTSLDGSTVLARGTWTANEDGTVRQLFEKSKDEGATWKVKLDLTYHPVEAPADDASSSAE